MSEAEESSDAVEPGAMRRRGRRWIVILALILVPLAVVVPAAVIVGKRVAMKRWVRQHGEVGGPRKSLSLLPPWLPKRLRLSYHDVFDPIVTVRLKDVEIGGARMRQLAALPELEAMKLTQVTSAGPALLPAEGFRPLEDLDLKWLPLSREALARIGRLPKLRGLKLEHVDGASMAPFFEEPFGSLVMLELVSMRLEPEELEHIGHIASLEQLWFIGIDFASMSPFAGKGFRGVEELSF